MSDFRPVGVFDSGVGGISTLGELSVLLPREQFIYYGDSAHAPYGTKPEAEVLACVRGVMKQLIAQKVKAVVIACNTATAVAAATLREEIDLPILGMEPALKPASEIRKNGQILVLATPVTLSLPKFASLMDRYGEGAVPLPCPGLMELVEQEDFEGAKHYLQQLLASFDLSKVDAVVLGCTHYVFLRPVLRQILPKGVPMLDGNHGTACQLRRVLQERNALAEGKIGGVCFQTSGEGCLIIPQMKRLMVRATDLLAEAEK